MDSVSANKTHDEGDGLLRKTSSVLVLSALIDQRKLNQPSYVFFTYDDVAEASPRIRKWECDIETWEEMGKPEIITVTAAVGDQLQ